MWALLPWAYAAEQLPVLCRPLGLRLSVRWDTAIFLVLVLCGARPDPRLSQECELTLILNDLFLSIGLAPQIAIRSFNLPFDHGWHGLSIYNKLKGGGGAALWLAG